MDELEAMLEAPFQKPEDAVTEPAQVCEGAAALNGNKPLRALSNE